MSYDFKGKTILVNGAASGMGKHTAIMLSSYGAKVVMVDVDIDKLQEAVKTLVGVGHVAYQLDLSNLSKIDCAIKDIVAIAGPLDGFVHCVGLRCRRPLKLITPNILNEVMSVNYGSFIEMTRCITKKGNFNSGLSIVAISSISSKTGGAAVTVYSASKAALDASVRCLAKELYVKGIRLNTVQPGQVNTPAYAAMLINSGGVDNVLERQYLGLAESEDVSNVIVFLLSGKSKMITGASIPVDGGYFTS